MHAKTKELEEKGNKRGETMASKKTARGVYRVSKGGLGNADSNPTPRQAGHETRRKGGRESEEHTLRSWEHAGGLVLKFEARHEAMNPGSV